MEYPEKELEKHLLEAGNKLLSPPSSTPELLASLDLVENLLAGVEQSPTDSMKEALVPSTKALIAEKLLRHSNVDVKVAVASCISEITRITAPDAPYEDDQMKEVFQLIVSSFEKLDDTLCRSYAKRISILETVAKVRSCVVMLDLECDKLIVEMFQHFFRTIRDNNHEFVFSSMETIMTLVVEESEDISVDLISSILNVLKKENKEVLPIACQLGEKVIVNCASKLKPYLLPAIRSGGASLDEFIKAVADVYQAGDEAVDPIDGDAANKNLVAMETLEDAPPSEEVGPSAAGSPKTIMSNGILQKDNDNTTAANDNSKEADNEKAEPSKTIADSVGAEEPPKYKSKQEKSSRRKGRKPNSTKSSSEPLNPIVPNRKTEDVNIPELQDNAIDADNVRSEDPAIDTAEAADDEKSSEAPIPSPKTSDNECVDISSASPSESLADETRSKKTERGNKIEDPTQDDEIASDVDSEESDKKKKFDTQVKKEATGSECKLNKHTDKKASSASDQEESAPDSADDTKEDDNIDELDGNSAQDLAQETEVGDSQRAVEKEPGEAKLTPAKSHKKTLAKDERKKTVAVPKSTSKGTKYESDVEEALRSSSKRKRPTEEKAPKTKVYGRELVGATVKVWWPDDKTFYKGVVGSFDSVKKKHTVLYDDGDVEVLNLKEEEWQLIKLSEGRANDDDGTDESADETPKVKKAKTSTDLEAKRGKTMTSAKKSSASSSKSKVTPKSGSKPDTAKIAVKSKEEASKKTAKSDIGKSGKSTKVSKSGSKLSDDTPKAISKLKDDNTDTPKGSTKSRPGKSKGASKSKGITPKSVGKSSSGVSSKVKGGTSTNRDETDDESLEPERSPEKPKGKSQSTPKSQKSWKKRKRSSKG